MISIHAPREGSDTGLAKKAGCGREFQSTLPVRGATVARDVLLTGHGDFNPRSP